MFTQRFPKNKTAKTIIVTKGIIKFKIVLFVYSSLPTKIEEFIDTK